MGDSVYFRQLYAQNLGGMLTRLNIAFSSLLSWDVGEALRVGVFKSDRLDNDINDDACSTQW